MLKAFSARYIEGRIKKAMPNAKRSVPTLEKSFSLVAFVYSGTKHINIMSDSEATPETACRNVALNVIPLAVPWLTRVIRTSADKLASMVTARMHVNVNDNAMVGRNNEPCSTRP